DVVDSVYPFVERDANIQETIQIFASPGIHAVPVVETIGGQRFYTGVLFLQDIRPEISNIGS
ncbi:MAG: CBS domain-containing protein, partial [Candidatus Omnitrophica bacterium]|nr:CBS domain-containing protein [Candidatus Omnitrophota bacterium]